MTVREPTPDYRIREPTLVDANEALNRRRGTFKYINIFPMKLCPFFIYSKSKWIYNFKLCMTSKFIAMLIH